MKPLPLNALRAFAAVYSNGGVRAAGRELGISHSAVSRHLSELEAWLGVPLSDPSKGRRALKLTVHGDALGRSIQSAFSELENATSRIIEARTSNTVVISVAPSFASRWLLARLSDFERQYADIELSVSVDQRPVPLAAGQTDIAIRMSRRPPSDANCIPLMSEMLYPVMSPAYWERVGRPTEPDQLIGLRLIHDRDPDAAWGLWRAAIGPAELDIRSGPRYTSSDLVLRAAAQGLGVGLARHQLTREDLASGILIRPLSDLAVPLGTAYWILTPTHPLTPRISVARVVAWLKQSVDEDGPPDPVAT